MNHKQLCSAIKYLSNQEKKDASDSGVYVNHLTPTQHAKVAKLVGKRYMVQCVMNNVYTQALWDTMPKFPLFLSIGLLRTCQQLIVTRCVMTRC